MTDPSLSPPPGPGDVHRPAPVVESPGSSTRTPSPIDRLVGQAQAGSQSALVLALESLSKYLWLVADECLDDRLRAKIGASDLVQVTLQAAHRHFERFQGRTEGELRAWLSKILLRRVQYVRRKYAAQKADVQRELRGERYEEFLGRLCDPGLTPASDAAARDEIRRVRLAMAELNPRAREVLIWHTFQGVTFVEIGRRRDCSADAARKQWARALRELQRILDRTK